MTNLVIIGARGGGREVVNMINQDRAVGKFKIKGFLDDNPHVLDGYMGSFPPILSSVEEYVVQPEDFFICALGDSQARKKYSNIIEGKGGKFCSLISKNAIISNNSVIGDGTMISDFSIIDDNVHIGKHCLIYPFCTVGHNSIVGDYVSIEAYCFLGGGASLGNGSVLHTRASIMPHISVGDDAVVGSASVVISEVNEGSHVFGIPAKKMILY